MAKMLNDWIIENSDTIGTGSINLTGAISINQAKFKDGLSSGNVYYSWIEGGNREAGIAVFDGNNSLVRSEVQSTLVNGVFNDANPIPLAMAGEAVVSVTFNSSAYQSIVDELSNHETRITSNTNDITAIKADSLTVGQLEALDASNAPNSINPYITQIDMDLKMDTSGGVFTGAVEGQTPVAPGDLTRKDYVDSRVDSTIAFGSNSGRNFLMNGDFQVWQRGTSFSGEGYTADRWHANNSAVTVDKGTSGTATFMNISVAALAFSGIEQKIEASAFLTGLSVTISFQWEAIAGDLSEALISIGFSGKSAITALVPDPLVSENKTISVTLNNDASIADTLDFKILLTGTSNLSATARIYTVQVEPGDFRSAYDYVDTATEFMECQRYFRVSSLAGQAEEFQYSMRALPVETGANPGPWYYDAEL